jgi:hypothetical protein
VSNTVANARIGNRAGPLAKQDSVATRWQRTESGRGRTEAFSTRLNVASSRPNADTGMYRLGRS